MEQEELSMETNVGTRRERWMALKPFAYRDIARAIETNALYEVNFPGTWSRIHVIVSDAIDEYWGECLSETKIVCDGTVNTPDTIQANEFHLKFFWKIDPTDEWTIVEFTLSPSGMEVK